MQPERLHAQRGKHLARVSLLLQDLYSAAVQVGHMADMAIVIRSLQRMRWQQVGQVAVACGLVIQRSKHLARVSLLLQDL